jgi:hypothetical protein
MATSASDYPHMGGTFGHTQDTLHRLFDGVDRRIMDRVLLGSFAELFRDAPLPPPPGFDGASTTVNQAR